MFQLPPKHGFFYSLRLPQTREFLFVIKVINHIWAVVFQGSLWERELSPDIRVRRLMRSCPNLWFGIQLPYNSAPRAKRLVKRHCRNCIKLFERSEYLYDYHVAFITNVISEYLPSVGQFIQFIRARLTRAHLPFPKEGFDRLYADWTSSIEGVFSCRFRARFLLICAFFYDRINM